MSETGSEIDALEDEKFIGVSMDSVVYINDSS
jgi:hypothetical protein